MISDRAAVITGLCYSLPLAVWCLPQLYGAPGASAVQGVLRDTVNAALLLQMLTVVLFAPRFTAGRSTPIGSGLLLICVPWPLLVMSWLSGAVGALLLALSQVAAVTLAWLAFTLSRRLDDGAAASGFRQLTVPVLQVLTITLILGLVTWLPEFPL